MEQLSAAQLHQVSGGRDQDCTPVDRRPVGPLSRSYNQTDPGTAGGWTAPPPQWFYQSAQ